MKHVFSAGCTLNRRKNKMEIRSARRRRRQPTTAHAQPPYHPLILPSVPNSPSPLRSSTSPFHQQSETWHLTSPNLTLTSPYCAFLGTAPCWPPTNLLISVASVACLMTPFTVSHPCLTTGGVPCPAIIASTLATAWAIAPCTKLLWEYLARTKTV